MPEGAALSSVPTVTAEQMREVDRIMVEDLGVLIQQTQPVRLGFAYAGRRKISASV